MTITIKTPGYNAPSNPVDMIAALAKNANEPASANFTTVAGLPTAAGNKGVRFFVSDATVTTFYSIVAGSGTNFVPVFSDNTNWRIG